MSDLQVRAYGEGVFQFQVVDFHHRTFPSLTCQYVSVCALNISQAKESGSLLSSVTLRAHSDGHGGGRGLPCWVKKAE